MCDSTIWNNRIKKLDESELQFAHGYRQSRFEKVRDCNWNRTHNHIVRKRALNYLAKLAWIWPLWLNEWAFIYWLSNCLFKSSCNHLNFRYCAYFEQRVHWHSGNSSMWIHSETREWHDKKMHSIWKTT